MSMNNKIYYYLDQVEKLERGEFVPPITCEIDPSNRCMLKCNFCMFENYRQCSKQDLDLDIYIAAIAELHMMGTRSITFTGGGEPLMNPHFDTMIKMAVALGFEVGLVTNGVFLNKIERDLLDKFLFIRVSLDAYNKEDYKKVKGADHFDRVLQNITDALKWNKIIGLSYVVGPDNNKDLYKAEELAKDLDVAYIQIKPAYINGSIFSDFEYPDGRPTISTIRHMPKDNTPCTIAALVGILGADANLYYCCQQRGIEKFNLGSLYEYSFKELWTKRLELKPNITTCPPCRYMNYAMAYKKILDEGDMFFQHRYFL